MIIPSRKRKRIKSRMFSIEHREGREKSWLRLIFLDGQLHFYHFSCLWLAATSISRAHIDCRIILITYLLFYCYQINQSIYISRKHMIDMMTNDAKENNKFCQHLEFFCDEFIAHKMLKRWQKKNIHTPVWNILHCACIVTKEVVTEHHLQVDHYIPLRQGLRSFGFLCV